MMRNTVLQSDFGYCGNTHPEEKPCFLYGTGFITEKCPTKLERIVISKQIDINYYEFLKFYTIK
jgi:hypothetical protein